MKQRLNVAMVEGCVNRLRDNERDLETMEKFFYLPVRDNVFSRWLFDNKFRKKYGLVFKGGYLVKDVKSLRDGEGLYFYGEG